MPKPLTHRELLKKLREFGVVVVGHGKDEILGFASGVQPNGSYKGPQISIKNHGGSTEHSGKVIKAVLRRFEIKEEDFWK